MLTRKSQYLQVSRNKKTDLIAWEASINTASYKANENNDINKNDDKIIKNIITQ